MAGIDTTELIIGDTPQFFFDNGMIEEVQNLTRTMHRPEKQVDRPLLTADQPWEHVSYFTGMDWTLRRDKATGRFHCQYTDMKLDREKMAREGGTIIDWANVRQRQLYAYSDDGLNWVKPPMGRVHEDGLDTNIVYGSETYGNVWGMSAFEDPLETDPDKRFKGIHVTVPPGGNVADEPPGALVRLAYAEDGIHWKPAPVDPIVGETGGRIGDSMFPTYDPATRTYLLTTRHPQMTLAPRLRPPSSPELGASPNFDAVVDTSNRRSRRRIYQSQSADYIHWSEPRLILAPDPELDNLDDAFYGMMPYRLGGHWIGFLQVFHMVSNTLDVQLLHSRDGRKWNRLFPGQPWLQKGGPGSWDEFYVSIPRIPDTDGPEIMIFHGGAMNHHDWWQVGLQEGLDVPEASDWSKVRMGLGLAKLRRNGFVSLDAHRVREGMLMTQPFISPGTKLLINARCAKGGYVKVEVQDVNGTALPGRSSNECDVFTGDSVVHTVKWGGDTVVPLPEPTGGEIVYRTRLPYRKLRFIMRDAEIYSFQLLNSESA